jgi:hypothetical protein
MNIALSTTTPIADCLTSLDVLRPFTFNSIQPSSMQINAYHINLIGCINREVRSMESSENGGK